jgi:hypothetical protein
MTGGWHPSHHARRGVPIRRTTSALISTRTGAASMPANTADPGADARRSPRTARRVGHLAQAVGGHLEYADPVGGAEAVLGGRRM